MADDVHPSGAMNGSHSLDCLVVIGSLSMPQHAGPNLDFGFNRPGEPALVHQPSQMPIVISRDEPQLHGQVAEPAKLRFQRIPAPFAVHDIAKQDQLAGWVILDQPTQPRDRIIAVIHGQQLSARTLCPRVTEMQIRNDERPRFLKPCRSPSIEPKAGPDFTKHAFRFEAPAVVRESG